MTADSSPMTGESSASHQPSADQADRLTRLAQRRPAAHPRTAGTTARPSSETPAAWAPPQGAAVALIAPTLDRHSNVPVFASRRRHAAAASRVLVSGLAGTAFLGTVSSLALADAAAAKAKADAATKQSEATPSTVVVVNTVHRTVFVDEFGNPIDPATAAAPSSSTASPATTAPAVETTALDALAASTVPATLAPTSVPTTVATKAPPAGAPPSATQPAPVVTQPAPVVTQPAPVVTQPAPVVTEPPPVATQPPPVVTQPVVTQPVVTTPPPPPPTNPPPPACQGTQCP